MVILLMEYSEKITANLMECSGDGYNKFQEKVRIEWEIKVGGLGRSMIDSDF